MAFLGRVPGQLALRPVLKQTITPDGSASFTLDNQVSQNALDVFVNNVRQEPGVAYTVSGTTITFTEAPAVGSSVYIVYQKSVLGAEVLPGPDTLTTAMIKDGAITAAKLATSVDTHDSAAVQAQFDSAFPSAFDTRFALQDTHDSAAVAAQISATIPSITDSGGNVGIGVDPTNKLDIGGGITVQQAADIKWQNTARNTTYGGVKSTASALHLTWNDDEKVTVNSGGSVGINTTDPSALLEIAKTGAGAQLLLTQAGTDQLGLIAGSQGTGIVYEDENYFAIWSQDYADRGTESNLTERMRITSSGDVGINTTDPVTALEVDHGFDAGTTSSRPAIVTDGSYGGGIALEDGSQECGFYTDTFGQNLHVYTYRTFGSDTAQSAVRATFNHLGDLTLTRNLKVGSGNGIDFSASGNAAGMSSELLDDYEEGTWTPTVTTASSVNVNQAQYTKIGRSVTVSCYISWTNDQNNNTSTWNIGGLPFTGTLSNNFEAGSIGYTGAVQSDDFLLLKHANASILYMHKSSGGDSSTWDNAEITTRGLNVIIVTVTYQLPS